MCPRIVKAERSDGPAGEPLLDWPRIHHVRVNALKSACPKTLRHTPQFLSARQIEEFKIAEGELLKAWIDPTNEYNAILDIKRPDF